ncbi:MAG: class I SAM-dependent DNA methyltransferase, partial [Selenomonadaceae bacterium]|nr:class I SAM-dependent DNA methyltransferase [Selenomonadaceae bacterium]
RIFKLSELHYVYPRMKFIVDPNAEILPEVKLAYDAASTIKIIYEAFEKNYKWAEVDGYKNFLDKLCMRLVFCFYASYAQIIDDKKFFKYLAKFDGEKRFDALQEMFAVLNTDKNARPADLDDELKSFPHINGKLFAEKIPLPKFNRFDGNPTDKIIAADNPERINWRIISSPIFGAMFESVLNDDTRREGGMHYTTLENIDKVINPLFFDDLKAEFKSAKSKFHENRPQALLDLQDKISKLTFLDPACGSGNFLTNTYIRLRELENEILKELRKEERRKNSNFRLSADPIKVSINQFYGIEIHDFAVAVTQVAMYIAENQMLQKTNSELAINVPAFPLQKYAKIVCANALRVDWLKVFKENAPDHFDYIIGNPPFVGARMKSAAQADDIRRVFDGWQNLGNLDYVTCWYKKAADLIAGTKIRCAFVSTNSVCQGDQVGALWKNLFAAGDHIDFARRTFKWLSDSYNPAHVHCVIVGFSVAPNSKPKIIFDGENFTIAKNINAYLVDGENIFVESRKTPIQDDVPEIGIGNKPIDGGNYLFNPKEMRDFIKREPASEKYFKPWYGAEEFIRGKRRYCLWLGDVELDEIKKMPLCWERVEAVKNYRLASKSEGTRKIAATPTRFHVENFPQGNYLLIPSVSSERRQYIPIGFMNPNELASNLVLVIPNAELYHFGILTSSIHMDWLRTVGGRLESRYRYSKDVVYNNFIWVEPTDRQKQAIEQSAQKILDVRAVFKNWTFAELYNPHTMPKALYDAHKMND